jgi:hypothetical protein
MLTIAACSPSIKGTEDVSIQVGQGVLITAEKP